MPNYEIKRWDVILVNDKRVPIIYIKPDIQFMNLIRKNNYNVICVIHGTRTVYDNNKIYGVVNESMYVPNCRPNFFNETGLYVITLDSSWNGYPSIIGNVDLYGVYEQINPQPTYQPTYQPTFEPTYQPTFEPTFEPTYQPTFEPTYQPTFEPTY